MSAHNIPFQYKKRKISLNYLKSATVRFFQGTLERVRNSRGKRAISARATEVLLYFVHVHTVYSIFEKKKKKKTAGYVINRCLQTHVPFRG